MFQIHKPTKYGGLGYVRDHWDRRDYLYRIRRTELLPDQVDLRSLCPPIYDQQQLGSCTANAIAAAMDFERKRQNLGFVFPSRLFIYYNERMMEGTVDFDAGAMIRDGIKSINSDNYGMCPESMWGYDTTKFDVMPDDVCYKEGTKHPVLLYERLDNRDTNQLKACLASGHPFVFGFSVYESFESEQVARTGIAPMPDMNKEQFLGGHAVLAVGYIRSQNIFIVRNSWGEGWGDQGYFYMPMPYLTNPYLSDDFWQITSVQ